jgi:hypothetical protein
MSELLWKDNDPVVSERIVSHLGISVHGML